MLTRCAPAFVAMVCLALVGASALASPVTDTRNDSGLTGAAAQAVHEPAVSVGAGANSQAIQSIADLSTMANAFTPVQMTVVPEPAAVVLLCMGGAVVLMRRRRASRSA